MNGIHINDMDDFPLDSKGNVLLAPDTVYICDKPLDVKVINANSRVIAQDMVDKMEAALGSFMSKNRHLKELGKCKVGLLNKITKGIRNESMHSKAKR